jgi:transposase
MERKDRSHCHRPGCRDDLAARSLAAIRRRTGPSPRCALGVAALLVPIDQETETPARGRGSWKPVQLQFQLLELNKTHKRFLASPRLGAEIYDDAKVSMTRQLGVPACPPVNN